VAARPERWYGRIAGRDMRSRIMSSGTAVPKEYRHQIDELVNSIHSRHSSLDALAKKLRTPAIRNAFDKWDHNSWCISVAGDSIVRIRLFIEHNFNYIETMSVISVTRYMHELSVWLHLFKRDRRYGLVYFDQLLDTQHRYYQDEKMQLEREVALLSSFAKMENEELARVLERLKNSPDVGALLPALNSVSQTIDVLASKRFSIYAKDAQANGYGFEAYLIETKAIPRVEQALADIACERKEFDKTVPRSVKDLIPKRWQWRLMAQKVNLVDEYDYIYSISSKLLHATPVSITTDQKNLEFSEMRIFLKYIDVKINEILLLAEEYSL
jgi:hypothetical protein